MTSINKLARKSARNKTARADQGLISAGGEVRGRIEY
jgi:hypothetical protein